MFRDRMHFDMGERKPLPKTAIGALELPKTPGLFVVLLARTAIVATQQLALDQNEVMFKLAPDDPTAPEVRRLLKQYKQFGQSS